MKVIGQREQNGLEVSGEFVSGYGSSPYYFKGGRSGISKGDVPYFVRGSMHGAPYYPPPTLVMETAARYYGIVSCWWCGCNIPESVSVCSRCGGPNRMARKAAR